MAITLDGTAGVTATEFDGALDASNLTGALPAIDGSAVTALTAGNLTGALPAIDGSALTGIDTSPPTAYDSVGTYGFFRYTAISSPVFAGSTYAGSSLVAAGSSTGLGNTGTTLKTGTNGSSPSGTWRAMGYHSPVSAYYVLTLFVRIS